MGGRRTAAMRLLKDEFLAPRCCRKQGTNPLVLTGNKEDVTKILWDGGKICSVSFRNKI